MSRRSGRRELVGYILFSGGFRSRQWNDNRQICRCRAEGAVFQDVVEEERVVFEGEVESDRLRTDVERALWSIARKTEDLAFYVVSSVQIDMKIKQFLLLPSCLSLSPPASLFLAPPPLRFLLSCVRRADHQSLFVLPRKG